MNRNLVTNELAKNLLIEDILLSIAEDIRATLSSGDVDPGYDDTVTLIGLYGLFELFRYHRATWLPLLQRLESLREKVFHSDTISLIAGRADLQLNKLENYICNYITSQYCKDPIGQLHWAAKIYKLVLILCGFYLAAAEQNLWTNAVASAYFKFSTMMNYYVWRLRDESGEETLLRAFLFDVWSATKSMVDTANNVSSST